jgi:hypothetical protein
MILDRLRKDIGLRKDIPGVRRSLNTERRISTTVARR